MCVGQKRCMGCLIIDASVWMDSGRDGVKSPRAVPEQDLKSLVVRHSVDARTAARPSVENFGIAKLPVRTCRESRGARRKARHRLQDGPERPYGRESDECVRF